MAFVIADRVRETTTTIGTGSVTLGGAYTSFQTFSAAIGNGNNTYYTIASASSGEWEVGIGTYASGGNLLSRDTVLASSNAGNLVNFSVGSKDVFVTQPSERSLLINAASNGLFAGNAAFTANGVLYANSTTTLTTGSALTFDGSALTIDGGTLGYIKGPVGEMLIGQDVGGLYIGEGFGVNPAIPFFYGSPGTTYQAWKAGGSEQMRLTSTGLGIGTSSPGQKLDVSGADGVRARVIASASGTSGLILSSSGATAYSIKAGNGDSSLRIDQDGTDRITLASGGNVGIGTSSPARKLQVNSGESVAARFTRSGGIVANNSLEWFDGTNGWYAGVSGSNFFGIAYNSSGAIDSAALRLDSSGNLGLGVTPSASVTKAIQVGASACITGDGLTYGWTAAMSQNAYMFGNNTWKYVASTTAALYLQDGNLHKWYTAPSGTAGNAISFTQAMTLDASGNLGIGTSSPGAKLDVNGGTNSEMRLTTSGSGYLQVGQFTNGAFIGTSSSDATAGQLRLGTGGAAQVWLSTSGNLGVGTSSPAGKLDVTGANGAGAINAYIRGGSTAGDYGILNFANGSTIRGRLVADASSDTFRFDTSGGASTAITFLTGSSYTERMHLDSSGNLGLGVTPSAWVTVVPALDIAGGASVYGYSNGAFLSSNLYYNGGYKYKAAAGASYYQQASASHYWWISNNTPAANGTATFTQAMTLDSSGNLGVGTTTPTNYGSGYINIEAKGTGTSGGVFTSKSGGGSDARFYVVDTSGQLGTWSNIPMLFYTNSNERMRLDASGRQLIGLTSAVTSWGSGAAQQLQVTANNSLYPGMSSYAFSTNANAGGMVILGHSANTTVGTVSQTAANDNLGYLIFEGVNASNNFVGGAYISATQTGAAGASAIPTALRFFTSTSSAIDERARIDSSGNFGIGQTNPQTALGFANTATISWGTTNYPFISGDQPNNTLTFGTQATERARIDSSGNLLVGTTNAAENAGPGMKVLNTGGTVALVSTASDATQQGFEMYSTTAAAYRLYINYAGTINATSTTISAISDQRLKENIQDIDVGLDAIMALKPRKFDWKAGKGKDIKGDRGWIAQEFEQVFPDMIDEWRDPAPEGEEPYKSVRADLIPILVKAIQELKAEFDAYKATHP